MRSREYASFYFVWMTMSVSHHRRPFLTKEKHCFIYLLTVFTCLQCRTDSI